MAARAFPILVEIQGWLEGDPSRAAIVVAHNHVNRLWLTSLLGWPMADYRRRSTQDPAGYSLIELNGGVPAGPPSQRDADGGMIPSPQRPDAAAARYPSVTSPLCAAKAASTSSFSR